MDSETRAIYGNECYKNSIRQFRDWRLQFKDGVSDAEFAEILGDAMDQLKDELGLTTGD